MRIKLKHGEWEVEITCLEGKVKDVVASVLATIDSSTSSWKDAASERERIEIREEIEALKLKLTGSGGTVEQAGRTKIAKSSMTCRGLLDTLWLESFLGQERALAEVHEELGRRGYNYDKTAVAHSLADMVREGILTRTGTMRNFRYIQKRPPSIPPSNGLQASSSL